MSHIIVLYDYNNHNSICKKTTAPSCFRKLSFKSGTLYVLRAILEYKKIENKYDANTT